LLDTGVVPKCNLVARVEDRAVLGPRADHQDQARIVACADRRVGPRARGYRILRVLAQHEPRFDNVKGSSIPRSRARCVWTAETPGNAEQATGSPTQAVTGFSG